MFSYSIVNNIIIFNFIGNITIDNFKQYCETINNIYSMKKDMYLIYNLKKASIPLHLLPNQDNHMIKCKEDTLKYVKASSIIDLRIDKLKFIYPIQIGTYLIRYDINM